MYEMSRFDGKGGPQGLYQLMQPFAPSKPRFLLNPYGNVYCFPNIVKDDF
jgi:hypothetical protein